MAGSNLTPHLSGDGPGAAIDFRLGAGDSAFGGEKRSPGVFEPARNGDIWSLPVDANQGKAIGKLEQVTQGGSAEASPSISADGKSLVFVRTDLGTRTFG